MLWDCHEKKEKKSKFQSEWQRELQSEEQIVQADWSPDGQNAYWGVRFEMLSHEDAREYLSIKKR